MKTKYRYGISALIIIIGAFMVSLVASYELHSLFLDGGVFSLIYQIIHIPAWGIVIIWGGLRLPRYGDAAIIFIPSIAVGLQWLILLLIFISLTGKKAPSKPDLHNKLKKLKESTQD